jgi:hypothetical protein
VQIRVAGFNEFYSKILLPLSFHPVDGVCNWVPTKPSLVIEEVKKLTVVHLKTRKLCLTLCGSIGSTNHVRKLGHNRGPQVHMDCPIHYSPTIDEFNQYLDKHVFKYQETKVMGHRRRCFPCMCIYLKQTHYAVQNKRIHNKIKQCNRRV